MSKKLTQRENKKINKKLVGQWILVIYIEILVDKIEISTTIFLQILGCSQTERKLKKRERDRKLTIKEKRERDKDRHNKKRDGYLSFLKIPRTNCQDQMFKSKPICLVLVSLCWLDSLP